MILCADIGGTKSLLGLARDGQLLADRRYANADFPDFAGVLAAFFADTQTDPALVTGGCLAVAGPIADDGRKAALTNLPWSIDSEALSRRFGLPALRLANDFAAAAAGAITASATQRLTLQEGEAQDDAPRLVVGAGTGLGMAIALPQDGGTWKILAGEGGHVAFAPAEAQRFKERSASERVNSLLKERYGGRWVRVRGAAKVMCHLMFGLVALTATALFARLC